MRYAGSFLEDFRKLINVCTRKKNCLIRCFYSYKYCTQENERSAGESALPLRMKVLLCLGQRLNFRFYRILRHALAGLSIFNTSVIERPSVTADGA